VCGVVKKFEEYKVVMVIVAILSATVEIFLRYPPQVVVLLARVCPALRARGSP